VQSKSLTSVEEMTDVLTMSENAGTLAQQIGEYLATQGSTAEMKALGANILSTAAKLSTEIQVRRTRKAPAKSVLPAGLSAMNVLAAQKKVAEAATKKAIENAAAATTESIAAAAKKPLMSMKKGILTRLPPLPSNTQEGGYRRRTRRVRRKNFA
jgi:hypothetical protein